jgi:hypothetical protein
MHWRTSLAGFAAVIASVVAISGVGHASTVETFTFTQNDCSKGCTTPFGSVVVTDNGTGSLLFQTTLLGSNVFIGSGFDASFAFNLATGSSYAGLSYTGEPAAFSPVSGTLHVNALGYFTNGLDVSPNGFNGGAGGQTLWFTLSDTANNLRLDSLVGNTGGFFFGADIQSGVLGNSGAVGALAGLIKPPNETPLATTPIPGALALFGSVLFGGSGFAFWRKRRSQPNGLALIAA